MDFSSSLARELALLSDRLTAAAARDVEEASAAAAAAHAAETASLNARIGELTAAAATLKKQITDLEAAGERVRAKADELAAANRTLALELADRVGDREAAETTAVALRDERERRTIVERERNELAEALERERVTLTTTLERERAEAAKALDQERSGAAQAIERERTDAAKSLERERSDMTRAFERARMELSSALEQERSSNADVLARATALTDTQSASLASARTAAQDASEAFEREQTARLELERELVPLRERAAESAAALQEAEAALEREAVVRATLEQETIALRRQAGSGRAAVREELADRLSAVFDDIARGASVEEVLGAAANSLSEDFARVAVLAVNDGRLEPRYQRGFDPASGVEQAIVALGDGSMLAGAARSDDLGVLAGDRLAALPFGGSPSLAVTAPISVRGELVALVYADNDGQPRATEATALRLADIVRRHTSLRLDRLTLELKTIGELRAYARMLLDEVEYVYRADVSARKPDGERVERLTENLRCARQIYQQRMALEGPALPSLLEEVIAAAIAAKSSTPFGRELAAIAAHAHPQAVEVGG